MVYCGDDFRRNHLQLPRPPAAVDPQTRNPDPFRHRRPPVRVDRQRIPDLLRHHVSHIGHSGGPLRVEEGDAGWYRRMVVGLHRRRPFDQRRSNSPFCRGHPRTGRADDLRRTDRGRHASGSRNATAPRPTVSVRRAVRWERSWRRSSSRGWPDVPAVARRLHRGRSGRSGDRRGMGVDL